MMEKLSKAKQGFLYGAPFPALAFYKIWGAFTPSANSLLLVSLLLFAYCALVVAIAYRWDTPTYFDWVTAAYFALLSGTLLLWPEGAGRFLSHYPVTGIYACLFAAAFFPPLLGMDPFTDHYARKFSPPEVWGNPVFVRINRIMTWVWSGIFAACILLSLYPSIITRAFLPLALILGVGIPFNVRFPDYYLKRLGLPSLAQQRRGTMKKPDRTPSSALKKIPLPVSAWEAVSHMPSVFDQEAAGDLSAVLGFMVTGAENFNAYLNIHEGICTLEDRPSRAPDLLIHTPAEVWLGISRRELDGQEAFMRRDFTAEGNLGLLMRMNGLFSGKPSRNANAPSASNAAPQDQPLVSGKENTMKVLALNSSPRGEGQSKTELMLSHLAQGMREAGAEVEVVALREKKVKNCIGCYTCWTKTPGVCIQKDDMTHELYPKLLQADLVVYATPLYHFTVNATMKTFIERTLPVIEPFFETQGEQTWHPLRHPHPPVVMLSVAGFPEDSVFSQLSSWANFLFRTNLAAEIYRPFAEVLTVPLFAEKAKDVLGAVTQAGRELVESKKVTSETLARIKQPLVEDKGAIRKMVNLMWKTCIAEGVTPKELEEKGSVPRPDSVDTFMMIMPMGFNPAGAGDTRAVLQFRFTGDAKGSCWFKIENGGIQAFPGTAEKPDLTIESPFEVWMDVITGKAEGQQMFMAGKYKVNGDLSLLIRMDSLFGKR
jgi:putative sterol carrier protein/putative NADPH-quinone reductase